MGGITIGRVCAYFILGMPNQVWVVVFGIKPNARTLRNIIVAYRACVPVRYYSDPWHSWQVTHFTRPFSP